MQTGCFKFSLYTSMAVPFIFLYGWTDMGPAISDFWYWYICTNVSATNTNTDIFFLANTLPITGIMADICRYFGRYQWIYLMWTHTSSQDFFKIFVNPNVKAFLMTGMLGPKNWAAPWIFSSEAIPWGQICIYFFGSKMADMTIKLVQFRSL